MQPSEVRVFLAEALDKENIPDFCRAFFELDHENLGGEGKSGKVRELVSWCTRRGRLDDLIKLATTIQLLGDRFNVSEIKTMAFDLGIDLENHAGGSTRYGQIIKLLVVLQDLNQYDRLGAWLQRNRPDIAPKRRLNPGGS